MAGHGLGLACSSGILNFALGEAFILLANGLNHRNSIRGLHVDVGEAMAHAILLSVEGDLFALGGHDNPIFPGVVAYREAVCLQLGQGEKIGNAVAD